MQRHDFDLISFLFGLLFAGIGASVIAIEEGFDPELGAWLWPALLIVAGFVVLSSTVARNDREAPPAGGDRDDVIWSDQDFAD